MDPTATMDDRSRANAHNHALPSSCARASIEADGPGGSAKVAPVNVPKYGKENNK
jgi:hypothetical protein